MERDKEEFKSMMERVRFLMEKYPETRNSDLYLIILYLRRYTELGRYIKYIPFDIIKKYDGITWSIRRIRQKIQETGELLPTDPEVLRRRKRLAKKYRKLMVELKQEPEDMFR